jgi:hypothetical protein
MANSIQPTTVAARSKARTVLARSNTGIVGSNPTQGMDVVTSCSWPASAHPIPRRLPPPRFTLLPMLVALPASRTWFLTAGP